MPSPTLDIALKEDMKKRANISSSCIVSRFVSLRENRNGFSLQSQGEQGEACYDLHIFLENKTPI